MVPMNAATAARRGWGEAEGYMGLAPLVIFWQEKGRTHAL